MNKSFIKFDHVSGLVSYLESMSVATTQQAAYSLQPALPVSTMEYSASSLKQMALLATRLHGVVVHISRLRLFTLEPSILHREITEIMERILKYE